MNPHADSVQQPSDDEERAAFEAWRRATTNVVTPDRAIARDGFGDDANYAHRATQSMWIGWKGRAIARFGTRPAAEPVSETYVQPVPDHCDRITWRNRYYSLPIAAEPIQSGSAGEAEEAFERHMESGAVHADTCFKDIWLAACAALSRQAPAAPAAVDFEQWWLAEVAANGGVPIGADYKHWAKAGFELRGDAEAMALLGWTRYEKARKLNVAQWAELHQRNLKGENFDDMIDALPATTQPVQQDTDEPDPWALRFKRALLAIKYNAVSLADAQVIALRALNGFDDSPPAEKQAAPSGEGEA
jgi:hypothetical protein